MESKTDPPRAHDRVDELMELESARAHAGDTDGATLAFLRRTIAQKVEERQRISDELPGLLRSAQERGATLRDLAGDASMTPEGVRKMISRATTTTEETRP